jgi:DNA-binding NarL/FixJ family response regulator
LFIASEVEEKSDTRLRVLLADDHLKILENAKRLLEPDYRVVGAVSNGLLALEAARELSPDLIVLDIEMPEMDGIRAAQEMRRLGLKARIFFLTVYEDEDYIAAARTLCDGYVLKSRMSKDLPHAIREALSGRFFVSRRVLEAG